MPCLAVLEVPVDWFQNKLDGDRHRIMYSSILAALSKLEAHVELRPVPFGSDAAPRIAKREQLVLSYHSYGSEGNVIRIKESYVPPYYTMDPKGYSGFSSLACEPDRYREEFEYFDLKTAQNTLENVRRQFREKQLSKYPQIELRDPALPSEFIFFPLQTIDDPVARFWRMDQLDALGETVIMAQKLGSAVVAKRHPMCKNKGVERFLDSLSSNYANFHVSNTSIHHLIEHAISVVGGNSGVLFEALVHGKPVYSLANSDFAQATTPIASPDHLNLAFDRKRVGARDDRDRFLGWYLNNYCVRADDIESVSRRIQRAFEEMDLVSIPEQSVSNRLYREYSKIEKDRRTKLL